MEKFALGNRIRDSRKARGLPSEALAELCGVGAVHIRKIEARTKLPSISLFVKLCNVLRVSSKFLLQDSVECDTVDLHGTWDDRLKRLPADQADFVRTLLETSFSYFNGVAGSKTQKV